MSILQRFKPARSLASRRGFAVAVAVLCLALLALLSVVQVVHTHPTASDADHCQLCIVLHAVAPAAVAVTAIILVQLGSSVLLVDAGIVIRAWHASLFIRPPPAVC